MWHISLSQMDDKQLCYKTKQKLVNESEVEFKRLLCDTCTRR